MNNPEQKYNILAIAQPTEVERRQHLDEMLSALNMHYELVKTSPPVPRDQWHQVGFNHEKSRTLLGRDLSCGEIESCNHCSVSLTYHRKGEKLICHYCDYKSKTDLICSNCGRNFFINAYERSALTILSWTSVLFIFALFLSPSSTAVDRLAIYISPLQILIFSRVPEIFGSYKKQNIFEITSVLLIFFTVNFIWLNYAFHAHHWLPYQSILFK